MLPKNSSIYGIEITMRQCVTLVLRIHKRRISFLKFILEGYDGLGVLSTIDSQQGLIQIACPRELYEDLMELVAALPLQNFKA